MLYCGTKNLDETTFLLMHPLCLMKPRIAHNKRLYLT